MNGLYIEVVRRRGVFAEVCKLLWAVAATVAVVYGYYRRDMYLMILGVWFTINIRDNRMAHALDTIWRKIG